MFFVKTIGVFSIALLLAGLPATAQSVMAWGGVTLTPLDGATVDDALRSSNSATAASIEFENRSDTAADIYWIDFNGNRVLFKAGLSAGSTWKVRTFLTHLWLVVASGTGGTTDHNTGVLVGGFEALSSASQNGGAASAPEMAFPHRRCFQRWTPSIRRRH